MGGKDVAEILYRDSLVLGKSGKGGPMNIYSEGSLFRPLEKDLCDLRKPPAAARKSRLGIPEKNIESPLEAAVAYELQSA